MKYNNFNRGTFFIIVTISLLVLMSAHKAFCLPYSIEVLTFDDFATPSQVVSPLPESYGGFHWEHAYLLQGPGLFTPCSCSGFTGAHVLDMDVLNEAGNAMTISRDGTFTWLGASFSAADFDSEEITIEGYLDGVLSFSTTFVLSELCPEDLKVYWPGIDELVIYATGDDILGNFTMDDFMYKLGCDSLFCRACGNIVPRTPGYPTSSPPYNPPSSPPFNPPDNPPPVPEPSTFFLTGAGIVLMALRRLGRKKM